jgi:hypothetical protein
MFETRLMSRLLHGYRTDLAGGAKSGAGSLHRFPALAIFQRLMLQ